MVPAAVTNAFVYVSDQECCHMMIFGRMAGCLDSSGIAELTSLPPTLISPSFKTGVSLCMWLLFFTGVPFLRDVSSSLNSTD